MTVLNRIKLENEVADLINSQLGELAIQSKMVTKNHLIDIIEKTAKEIVELVSEKSKE